MITIAAVLLIIGLAFLVGPFVLKLLLGGFSALAPARVGTTIYLCAIIIAFIVCAFMYGKTLAEKLEEEDRRRRVRKERYNLRKAIAGLSILAVLSMVLIVLNGVLTAAYEAWSIFMKKDPQFFSVLRYIGIVMIVGAVGFFLGKRYKEKNEQDLPVEVDYYDESEEEYGDAAGVYQNMQGTQYHVQNLGSVENRKIPHLVRNEDVRVVFSNPDDARRKLGG